MGLFHQEKRILNKLLSDLKSKLPHKKKKASADEEESSEKEITDQIESEDSSVEDESGGVTQASEISEEDLLDDEFEEDPEEETDKSFLGKLKAKFGGNSDATPEEKKKRFFFQGIIGVMLAYLIYDALISEDSVGTLETPPPVESPASQARRKQPSEPPPATEAPVETQAPETQAPETQARETPAPETNPDAPIQTSPMNAQTPSGFDETPTVEEPPVVEQPSEPLSETPDTSTVDPGSPDIPHIETIPSELETPGENFTVETLDGMDGDSGEDLTEKILQDLEKQASPPVKRVIRDYVAPPDYEYRGRGLVYNCRGKHWACVDGPSYRLCEDNITSVKLLGRSVECYPFNVYESSRGCESVQNRMVSSSAKTKFCDDN